MIKLLTVLRKIKPSVLHNRSLLQQNNQRTDTL